MIRFAAFSGAGVLPVQPVGYKRRAFVTENLGPRYPTIGNIYGSWRSFATATTNESPVLKIRETMIDVCTSGWKAMKERHDIGLFLR